MDQSQDRVILVNKPLEWTSFDVVNKLRRVLRIKKIGHAGTLDPLATGLLVVCTGKMTKQIDQFQAAEKEYEGTFKLGVSTPSHDLETEAIRTLPVDHLTDVEIQRAASAFKGRLQQIPPMHSAIKVQGKRAYELARQGKDANLKGREVVIHSFDILSIHLPEVKFRVVCSKGTYIRSLVRDFGEMLGVGACLVQLCRTRIGPFRLADAQGIDEIAAL